jgi:catechol 2,3-dioxygenase-like lactoylglutathione lyase family enzyme
MDDTTICCEAFFIIAVSDLDRALDFYRRVFDADHQFVDRGLNFVSLRSTISGIDRLILWQVPPDLPFERSRIRGTRLTCRCDDVARAHQTLTARGIPVSPLGTIPGIIFFVVTDPDGNEIGFFEFAAE